VGDGRKAAELEIGKQKQIPSMAVPASAEADIAYHGALGAKPEWHTAHLTVPAGAGPFPVFVYLHGGFWKPQWDRAATMSHMVTSTFDSAGEATPTEDAEVSVLGKVATLDVEYSRVNQDEPEKSEGGGGWPGTYLDALKALNALAAAQRAAFAVETGGGDAEESEARVSASVRAAAARVDLSAVVLSGHSAGGAMALWLGLFSSLQPAVRSELGGAVGAASGSAAAEAIISAGLDASIRILGVAALAPVANLALAAEEGISDLHDAVLNLFWRCTGGPDRRATVRAACPTSLMQQAVLPPLAHAPHFLLIHGDTDVDVPPSQSLSFAAAAWACPGDHPTWLMQLRHLDHLEVAGICVDPASGSEAARRWRTVQRSLRLFLAAVVAAKRAISPAGVSGGGALPTAEIQLSALCCSSLDDARAFCSLAKPHVCAFATVATIEAAAGSAHPAAAAELVALEQKFSPPLLVRGLNRWLEWNGNKPSSALAAWLAKHAQRES
jgi:acetyl esterase/lipase